MKIMQKRSAITQTQASVKCFVKGKSFLVAGPVAEKPNGFCEEAWSAITRYVFAFVSGGGGFFKGTYGRWMKDDNTMIACCNDGVRPVVFKLDRID